MADHADRIDALVAQARELVEEISKDGRQAVAAAESTADANVARHAELRDELASLRSRSEHVAAELERIPVLHSRATLEDDVDEELRLKDRYQDLKDEKEAAEARLPEVDAELQRLSPDGHEDAVSLRQYGQVNRAAAVPLIALRRLAKEIQDAATAEAGHFEQVIEDRRGESWSWRQNISWSEEARYALRKAGSVPGEDRTVTIKKDPDSLAGRGAEKL